MCRVDLKNQSETAWRSMLAAFAVLVLVAFWFPVSVGAVEDTTPPDPPGGVFVNQGSAWRVDAHFDVSWQNPAPQQSSIAAVHYELCAAVPLGDCLTERLAEEGITSLSIDLPHVGWFWLQIWLEDAAGNASPNNASLPVMLRFDNEVPPPGRMANDEHWLNAAQASPAEIWLETDPNAVAPLSGIGGYSLTLDGAIPDDTIDVVAAQDYNRWTAGLALSDLREGMTEIRIRGVSNTGVPSSVTTIGSVQLDATPPTISAEGTAGGAWQHAAVNVSVQAADQVGLSGLGPAPEGDPIEAGGYLEFVLDEAPAQKVRGSQAQLPISADGQHTLTVRATDLAGNTSSDHVVHIRIDQTPPTGSFESQDPADPRKLVVSVDDATSGVADGHIELRRHGATEFGRIPTSRQGSKLMGRLDDLALTDGRYELRALIEDVAGNEAVISRRAGGDSMVLDLPVRHPTAIAVDTTPVKRCSAVRRRGQAPRRRCVQVPGAPSPYGRQLASKGTLSTSTGARLPGAEVVVEGRARSGGSFAVLGRTRTDARGAFAFTIPDGPSRTVRYRYAGTDTHRPTATELSTKVAAAARLEVDRGRVRNGQAVRFAGRLLGRPIPKVGKLVALQARVGRRWRTFATARADGRGVFRHRYRFTATTGLRRYAFRAVVAREAAYPYERGVSRPVRVTVRGR
jgi:hypothetical protein